MSLRLRPRIDVAIELSPDEAMDVMRDALRDEKCGVLGHRFTRQYELQVPKDERHFWSPFLNLLIQEQDGVTYLRGRFGPNANVWTMFLATYTVLGLTGGVGMIVATSQWSIQQTPSGLYATVATIALAVAVYIAGKVGEKLADPHMERIRAFVASAYGVDVEFE